jgi:hypothetical protein
MENNPSKSMFVMLRALQSKHVYMGTVSSKVVARRRAKNRVARVSRRVNRGQR